MKVNNGSTKPNFTQLNNLFKMEKTGNLGTSVMKNVYECNVTSMCMSATYNGYSEESMPKGEYKQVEDNLCKFICTDQDVLNFYKKNHYDLYSKWIAGDPKAFWPNEIHDVLAYGFNKWMGKEIDTFNQRLSLNDYINNLINKISMPTSMTLGKLGHIISVTGFDTKADESYMKDYVNSKVEIPEDLTIIYDDPYGHCIDVYKGVYNTNESGNDNVISIKDFINCSKPVNEKFVMCHVMKLNS